MIVLPAIDLRDGHVVRLCQGDFARETRHGDDALATARAYAAAGARWLHVVDLDGARLGSFTQLDAIERLARDSGMHVQAGGGVRSADDVARLLDAGAARAVIGSVAVQQPDEVLAWIERHGAARICVALDVRSAARGGGWTLPVAGWTRDSGESLHALLACLAVAGGVRHVLSTDIASDGMLGGPALPLYRELRAAFPQLELQASGGVRDAGDVRALAALGVAGVVVGRALLEGRCTLRELSASC